MKKRILDLLRERTRFSIPVDESDESLDRILAACGLLLELASADGSFSDDERRRILAIIRDEYQLFVGDVEEIMNLAEEALKESANDLEFTKTINEHYSLEEKLFLVELLWRIVYADGKVDHKEEALIDRVALQLNIPHKEVLKVSKRAGT